ncbi:hypothetical protein NP233_g3051 [Leucocoprinus birnbaumii]|uniref:Rab-GAP TBC domain-containing protein n=1 Tax=Leucocoprinus birnbaumii TaxID=56174 RepID=A0AAD5VZ22_9AGAR|nr:hypothetical protein NP233_g3051 [Leucocoprinus birnbaumii]
MEESPLFLRLRTIAFCCVNLVSFVWIILYSVVIFLQWDPMERSERALISVMLMANVITLLTLLVLLLVEFRDWLDAARVCFLLIAQIGTAGAFAFWRPQFNCKEKLGDQQGICDMISMFILIGSWIIPVLLVTYLVGLAVLLYRRRPKAAPFGGRTLTIATDDPPMSPAHPTSARPSLLPIMHPSLTPMSPKYSHEVYGKPRLSINTPRSATSIYPSSRYSSPPVTPVSANPARLSKRSPLVDFAADIPGSGSAQLRSTIQQLGQLQARKDADAVITRKDIATLLEQGNVILARSKAQKLIQEDTLADLLELLEQQVGTLLDRFAELEQQSPPSPALVEASSSIIFAAPHVQLRDLDALSGMISDRLGSEAVEAAEDDRHSRVSPGILRATTRPIPSSQHLDNYLERIAKGHGLSWTAGPRRQDIANPLSEVLNPTTNTSVDIIRLQQLCHQGVPDDPVWLRPRIWKLLMNVIPADKATWSRENAKQRDSYYDLVRRLLKPFTELASPTSARSGPDATLLEVYKHLTRIPLDLLNQLDSEPEDLDSCPLHLSSPEAIRIPFANCLDARLQLLLRSDVNGQKNVSTTPEIRLEASLDPTPTISLTEPTTSLDNNSTSTTLLSSKTIGLGSASQKHVSALLRLLYIHASINPGNLSPYVPSLLVPLYTALLQEVEQDDLAHAEADAFWLFEAFVADFAELEEDERLTFWMGRFGEVLARQDPELLAWLNSVGLHPASSTFFSTLAVINANPYFTSAFYIPNLGSMAIAAKPLIFKQRKTSGLWDRDPQHPSVDPGEGFLESLTILQSYPVNKLGGIDTILQLMVDLNRGQAPLSVNGSGKKDQMGLGARLRVTMWKGFTNQVDSPERSDEEFSSDESEEEDEDVDDGNETETPGHAPQPNSLTSRIANTVWRGITNQSSMENPPSPVPPLSPEVSRPTTPSDPKMDSLPSPDPPKENANSAPANLWAYTEKLKDSDTMATLAKLSTNWRAKAMLTPWGRPKEPASAPVQPPPQETRSALTSPVQKSADPDFRRSSLPIYDHTGSVYSPPPRPSFFRNPRDSFMPSAAPSMLLSPTEMSQRAESPSSEKSSGGLLEKTLNLQSSLRSLTRTPSPMPPPAASKSGPRPLMLSSSSLMTSTSSGRSRVASSHDSIGSAGEDWADIMKIRKPQIQRDSMSSVSSLSPSDAINRKSTRSEYDSDTGTSRVVPLNRRSISPMAPVAKLSHSRPPSTTSTLSSDQAIPETPAKEAATDYQDAISIASPKEDEITPNGNADMPILPEQASLSRKSYRRKPPPSLSTPGDTSDSSTGGTTSRNARLRAKRYPPRLSNLQIDNTAEFEEAKQSTSPSNLAVPWPNEEHDMAATPKATSFDSNTLPASPSRSPKIKEERPRKLSNNSRHRKVSSSNRENIRRSRAYSAAEDGDDEGYDDLLSAYESEENPSLA